MASDPWLQQLAMVDAEAEQLRESLPPDVRLLVIADHGMVDSPSASRVDVDAEPELRDGLFLMGGEARFRHLYCRSGAVDDVAATWRSVLGDRADVLTREEAIGRGWFGAVEPLVMPRLGDVVVACRGDHAVISTTDFSYESTLIGLHGSLTRRRDADPAPRRLSHRRWSRRLRQRPVTTPGERARSSPLAGLVTDSVPPRPAAGSAERERLGGEADGVRAGRGQAATVVLAAQHLVRHVGGLVPASAGSSTSPTTITSPSTTITPFSVRALWVARLPHQHSASTWSTCIRSASSTSRALPGNRCCGSR